MPVSLLTVGPFVGFPVSGEAILSYDPTKSSPHLRHRAVIT
ncbi:protein of unknown function [Streptomyces sp. KY75]|nr:protein of unknown function [Streptomyces sp. KY70]CAD5982698.1 protein of unknown function [Streptomyces sp. KY75]